MKHLLFWLLSLTAVTQCFEFREVQAISQTSRVINSLTNNTFLFDRTIDNSYNPTTYASQAVAANASVILIFPNVYTLTSNTTCISIIVDSVAVNTFSCSVSGSSVTFSNVFNTISNLNVAKVVVTVGNIMNPSPAITISNFTGYIGTDYAVPLGASVIQLLPGAMQGCSITFTPGNVNLAGSTLIAAMTPSDPHPVGTIITMQFPRSTWTNDISSQQLPITSTMTCTNYSANVGSGVQCVGSQSTNLITMSNLFSTTVTSTFSIGISNFLSPPSNQPSDAIIITSSFGGSRLDTCTVYPSGLSPISFSNFSVTPLTTMRINSLASLKFSMYPSMTINQSDYFSITFPTNTTYSYNQIFGTGYYLSPPTFFGQTVLIYHNTATSATTYTQGALYSLTFVSFQSPPSTLTTGPLTIQILRNGYPIMFGTTTLTAVSSTLTASVSIANPTVWASTSYTFTITTSNPLTAQGMIRITFPSTVIPPKSQTSCASLIGINLNTLPTCAYDSGSNSITISNSNASSTVTTIPAQAGISLTINGVTNPPDTATTGSFTITTFYTSNTQGIVDVGNIAGVTCTAGTISINTISVVPSSYVAMQSGVTYTVNFNNTYIIPQNGYIILNIPNDITIVTALLPNYCRLSISGSSYFSTACSLTSTANSSFYQITFSAPAQSAAIPANSLISLQILSLCTNPTNTRIITPFQIYTYSSNAAIESRTTAITVQMLTPAQFTIVQVTRASQQNSALTAYTMTLKQQAPLPSGSILLINLPNELVFTTTSTCTDLLGANLNCTQGSFRSMQVTLTAVGGNTLFGVIITNIRNPPSYRPTATNFTFQTKTGDLVNSYATGVFSTPFMNSVPSTFSQLSYTFTPGQYGTSETLNLIVTPSSFITPFTFIVQMANSFTIQTLACSSQTGFNAPCAPQTLDSLNISGALISSQMQFSVEGFTSPTFAPSDYTFLSSYDNSGFLIDQSTTNILYAITCNIPCQSCTSNASACLSCYTNPNITSNIYLFSPNNTCLTGCPNGYYADTLYKCIACSATCLTCFAASSNCTSCNTTSAFPALNLTGNSGVCLSNCPIYYYLSTSLTPTQCTPCVFPCLTCTSLSVCLSCAPTRYFYNMTCLPTCPAEITIPNNGSWNCDACSSQCAKCIGTISTCDGCSTSAALYQGTCVTQCPYPLVISSGQCANCSTSCVGCSLVATNCTSCSTSSGNPFLFVSNSSFGSCLNKCPFTYYSDSALGLCKLCSSLNISCTNCSSTTTCYNCDYNSGLVFYKSQCLSYTPAGFYNDTGVAVPCNPECSSCLNATYCTSCVNLSLSNYQCVSNCSIYEVSVARVCVSCTFPCLTCSGSQVNCTSCNSTIANPFYLFLGSCLPSCPNYTFANPNGWTCSSCVSPCQMCSTNASCLSCTNGFNLFNQTCQTNCPVGFVGLNKMCTACTNNCSTCSGSTSFCLSCAPGTYLYNTSSPSCMTICPVGLYPNNASQSCTGCVSPCSTCSGFANNCTSCTTGLLQNFQCVGSCSVGYFALGTSCIPCNSNCTTCTSAAICTSCLSPLVLSGTSCVATCPPATPIVNSANKCSSCTDPFCLNCSAINFCYLCFYPKLYFQGACLSTCPPNYAADINLTNCVYSPANNSANSTLSATLSTTSIFPVPFSIGAAFLIIACLMSKFQHARTDVIGSLYALWGMLQWAAVVFLLLYYLKTVGSQDILKLSYLLVAGGLAWNYLLNIIFLFVQGFSLKKNKRFNLWLDGSINTCWYGTIVTICLITTGKFKFILFCKLFNFRSLSAKLDDVGGLRALHVYTFSSILASVATIAGGIYFLIDYGLVVNQLLMAYIDVVVLSALELVLGICNVKKESDYFQDIDEDGLIINKRIQIRDQDHPSGVMPQFNESERVGFGYKALESAKKLQSSYLSELSNRKSLRDISIQAQSILGERSLISRLGTETISDLSLFEQQDVSIQMDPIRDVQDVSIAVSERAKKHDVSIGQSVIFMDASVNHSLKQHDVSMNVDGVSRKDVSIDQTQKFQEEVSIQMEPKHCQISIQMDNLEQNQISVQYVPIYTDGTVNMSREEEDFGIQCNVDHQNISIQYSAKPLIQQVDEALRSQTSFSIGEPSDLDLQRKLVMHPPAPHETGMRVELELDIQEKLERKRLQLERLQEERKKRERQEAIKAFQDKGSKREVSVQYEAASQSLQHQQHQKKNVNNFFNNDYSSISNNLVGSGEELTLNLQEQLDKRQKALEEQRQQRQLQEDLRDFKKKNPIQHSSSFASRQLNQNRGDKINDPSQQPSGLPHNQSLSIDIRQRLQQKRNQQKLIQQQQANHFFNDELSNPSSLSASNKQPQNSQNEISRVRTEQEFLEMLSGNNLEPSQPIPTESKEIAPIPQQQQTIKVKFQTANNIIQNQQQIIDDEDITEHYEPLQANSYQYPPPSVEKSRSTGLLTGRPPLPRRQESNILESSQNSIEKSFEEQDEIMTRPIHPKREFHMQHRTIKKEEIQKGNKTSLTQFLQKKNYGGREARKNNLMDDDDALTKEIQNQFRQKPLPAPKADAFGLERSNSQKISNRPNAYRSQDRKESYQQQEDQLILEAQRSLNRGPNLPRSNSRKNIESEVIIQTNKPKTKGYLRETYTSQQKRKSLEKIYLNKAGKK